MRSFVTYVGLESLAFVRTGGGDILVEKAKVSHRAHVPLGFEVLWARRAIARPWANFGKFTANFRPLIVYLAKAIVLAKKNAIPIRGLRERKNPGRCAKLSHHSSALQPTRHLF